MILGLYPDLAKGALLDAAGAQHAGPLALVELENGGDAPTYVAGTENFYAITRYSWALQSSKTVRAAHGFFAPSFQ